MSSPHQIRRSRRLSHKSPMEVADYDWQSAANPLQLPVKLQDGFNVEITPAAIQHLSPPSPSTCTTPSADSPPSIVTHLPFAPGSSHTRNRKEGHIPRPPNAFMVFRSWLWNKDNMKNVERDNRNVSRIAGRYWNQLTEAERAPFRSMAEEAKARHAQLYPEYRYSPGSQKKRKVVQRRSQRCADAENDKCKKVADLLLGAAIGRDLNKYLGEEHQSVICGEEGTPVLADEGTRLGPRKRPAAPHEGSHVQAKTKKQKTYLPSPLASTPPFQYAVPLPILPAAEVPSEDALTPRPLLRTPELVHPSDNVQVFVPTDDIPHLSLDGCDNPMVKDAYGDLSSYYPSHLEPGAGTIFGHGDGVRPGASSTVNSCMLGAYVIDAEVSPSPAPFASTDVELVPLGSPVFTNPFEPTTAEYPAFLGTLDQLFGQPVSPLTCIFPSGTW